MKKIFAPGCALLLYKPHLADKLERLLEEFVQPMERLEICCRNHPELSPGTQVINVCPGCDRRYRENYETAGTISLWEVLADSDWFSFPDYKGKSMTITDACPTRTQPRVHTAVRRLLQKMNIRLVEPEKTGLQSMCCGDSFWGLLPTEEVKGKMRQRAAQMPVGDVVVYCVSCVKSMYNGGKTPRYLVDLLFGEITEVGVAEPDAWHGLVEEFVTKH